MKDRGTHGRKHICILDDEEKIVFTLTRLMRNFGYSSAGFSHPRDARIGIEHRTPDLLLSDINLPEISGIEFAMEVTERFPQCKVLLFSARTDTHDLVTDMARHGYSFAALMKPLHPEELMKKVRQLLGSRQETRPSGRRAPAALGVYPWLWEV